MYKRQEIYSETCKISTGVKTDTTSGWGMENENVGEKIQCNFCNYLAPSIRALKTHEGKVHKVEVYSEAKFVCTECDYRSKNCYSLKTTREY